MKVASQILQDILSERKASNASYSLRAFARDLGLSPSQLSNVMNGHRGLSPTMAEKVSNALSPDGHPNCSTCGHLKLRRVINTMTLSVAQFAA